MKLDGKTAVIVGGSGDIGRATAAAFAEAEATVFITSRSTAHLRDSLAALPTGVRGLIADPLDEASFRRTFAETGEFDYLVITLGAQSITMPFAQLPESQFVLATQEKLLNYTRVLRAALGSIRESVTWLTGAAARSAVPGLSNYGQANGALHGMLGALAMELAPVRINCVAAGVTRSRFWGGLGLDVQAQEALYSDAERSLPLKHVASTAEIAHALLFVATNTYSTGTVLDVNGGLNLGLIRTVEQNSMLGGV